MSSKYPALNDPAVAIDIYRGDTGLDSGRPQSLFSIDHRLLEQKRLTKVKRINLRQGEVRLDDGTVVRFDGATRSSTCRSRTTPVRCAGCWCSR